MEELEVSCTKPCSMPFPHVLVIASADFLLASLVSAPSLYESGEINTTPSLQRKI